MDAQDAFRLQHAQRIAERRHRNAEQLHQFVLRHEGAGRQAPVEQAFEYSLIGEVAEPPGRVQLDQRIAILTVNCHLRSPAACPITVPI